MHGPAQERGVPGREGRYGRERAEMAAVDPVSPELVLVSPELAERQRAALPDRPWESFASAQQVLRPPRLPELAAALSQTTAPPTPAPTSKGSQIASAVPIVLMAGFIAVIVVGSLPWVGERPTLGPRPSPAPPRTTTQPALQGRTVPVVVPKPLQGRGLGAS
jgi:hypothetical protein